MNEDRIMFQIGSWAIGGALLLTVGLQVCFRTQYRMLDHVRREVIRVQKETAVAEANFASYVRPEILRNLVMSTNQKSATVSFNKSVDIDSLPNKELPKQDV